jgi:hypothetical protein
VPTIGLYWPIVAFSLLALVSATGIVGIVPGAAALAQKVVVVTYSGIRSEPRAAANYR